MDFPPICSCPDFSITPPLDPPAIPCIVTPGDFNGGVKPPPPPCFLAGTAISMADDTDKNIEDIVVGDLVKAFNNNTDEVVNAKVTAVLVHPNTSGHYILNGDLNVTGDHRMRANNTWKAVENLYTGEELYRLDGSKITIETIKKVKGVTTTYNFEVENVHNYFANKYLVHNKKDAAGECKLAQECCPTSNEVKKLCYDPRKKPDWGKTIKKDSIQYEPKDEDCTEPCEDVLWLKEECPDPCHPPGGGDPCVDDPSGHPPGHSSFTPVIPPSTGTAVDDCCWWMWCPCNTHISTIATGNHGGGHNQGMFPHWPKPFTKSNKCPSDESNIGPSDRSHPGHWVRITGQGAAAKCGSVNPPGILGRYWGDVAIVCFCKVTPGSGLSFLRLGSSLSVRDFGRISMMLPDGNLSIRDVTNFGKGLSLRTIVRVGGSFLSLRTFDSHPIDNQYAQCCVCVKGVTGSAQDELNGTYCKKTITDTVYLREGNSQIRIEKKGGGWVFTVQGHIIARGKPLEAAHPADVRCSPEPGDWIATPAAAKVLGGSSWEKACVYRDKCDGTDSGEYLFNRLSFEDKQYVQVVSGEAMWNRPIQAQTLIDSSSTGTWGSSIQLRADGYFQTNHSATGTPHTAASMTIDQDSFNTSGGEWYVTATMYTAPTKYRTAETPYIVHPYATPFAVMNISAEISAPGGSSNGQAVGLLLKQGDKYYGCKIGASNNTNYSLFVLKGLTEESFCEIDIPVTQAPATECSYSVVGSGYTQLNAGYSDYPQFYADVDIDDHATTGEWNYDGGDQDANRFTHYGRPLMKADSHPAFSSAGAMYPIQLGLYVAHQVGMNLCVLKPDTKIKNLIVTVGC